MIKAIQRIKGLGVFANYTRPAGAQEFAAKNLIYGWNYSGKTTISRLFSILETKQPNPDISGCSFTFETENGPVTEANYSNCPQIVRVFNSDYTAKNINFSGGGFEPILLLGEESDKAQKELDRCEEMESRASHRVIEATGKISALNNKFRDAKTNSSAHIKKELGLVAAYTATHLQTDIANVLVLGESQTLSDDQFQSDKKLALTSDQERPTKAGEVSASLSLETLHNEAMSIMAKTPSLASTLDHLVKHPLIERWVESGLPIHEHTDKCEFCGGSLSEHRLLEIKGHFSKDLSDHKKNIDQLLERVEKARVSLNIPKEAELSAQFRSRLCVAVKGAADPIKKYNEAIHKLSEDLRKKIDSPFVSLAPSDLADGISSAVLGSIKEINDVITENNEIADNFTSEKQKAIGRLKKHYVQEFIDSFDISAHEAALAKLERKLDRFNGILVKIKAEILRLKAIISQAQRGREEINRRLEVLLGGQSVQINVALIDGQERFQLVRRSGKPARNLSEGEKTAISFCFFLTKLKELKPEQFAEAIIYIDDPISSLDSNHIFQVTAIIRETFFHRQADDSWSTKCKQIFFSTHNFEFFSLLRELKPDSKTSSRLFHIKKIGPEESFFDDMPKSLGKYSSEYQFLFSVINEFHKAPSKVDYAVLMLLPNAIRRFVELYTYSKYPGGKDNTVDQRADRIFGLEKSKRILKVLHYFSHANNIERLAENNELIFDIEAAVKDLFDTLKANDPLHLEALEASVT